MRSAIRNLIVIVFNLVPMMLSAALVTGAAYLVDRLLHCAWYVWLITSPGLYLAWLLLYLFLTGRTIKRVGASHPKPKYCVFRPDARIAPETRGMLTVAMCYVRYTIVQSLPLAFGIQTFGTFQKLVLSAYAPSTHLGIGVSVFGQLLDPDLTHIGDGSIIGLESTIVAHALSTRANGEQVYVTAPVRIGKRVTLGGGARVTPGCVIGDDAILEPGSVLAAFTTVPAGEVWGGNPARCMRQREGAPVSEVAAPPLVSRPSAVPEEELRQLVIGVLNLPAGTKAEELSASACAAWDSLGQVAIASALFDKYGIAVEPKDLFRIRTLRDIDELANNRSLAPVPSEKPAAAPIELPRDREMLPLLDAQEATRGLAMDPGHQPAGAKPLLVVVAATFTAEPITNALKLWGKAFGYDLECKFAGFDQVVPTLLDPSGPFAANESGVNVVLARPEDFDAGSPEETLLKAEQVLDAVERHAKTRGLGRQLLVGTLPPLVSTFAGLDRSQAESLRHRWETRLSAIPGVRKLEFGELVERLGVDKARNTSSEVLTRAPFSPALYQELGIALVRQILCGRRSPVKVIALDCDNTLWGEVVGEVGLDGIALSPDGRGRSFQLFQRALRRLKDRGFLLAVVSRNEERDVREVFEKHPDMILRPEDIAVWRVNWNRKSANLREIAAELNLGLDSFVLLDDDPSVRLEVASSLPEVHVVPLPADPAAYCETLARLWLFDGGEATDADTDRTAMVQQESLRQDELKAAGSLEEYFTSLHLRVDMHPPSEHEWGRVAQLTQRTNQFNLNLRRRTAEEVEAHCSTRPVWTLRAQDRFGDYGLVGVCILEPDEAGGTAVIETLLMSCRALGRGVEDAFLHGIAAAAARRGAARLTADFVVGPRNQLVREFLRRKGFVEALPSHWELSLTPVPELPPHVDFRQSDSMETVATAAARD